MSVISTAYDLVNVIILLIFISEKDFQKLKAGDTQVFTSVYQAYKKKVFNFLLVKCKWDQHTAEDLLSETMLSAFTSLSNLQSADNLLSWLLTIAFRRYLDHVRKQASDSKKMDSLKTELTLNHHPGEEDCLTEMDKRGKILILKMALDQLRPEYKQILQLKLFENQQNSEIARLLGKDKKAIENLYSRGLKSLKAAMKKYRDYFKE